MEPYVYDIPRYNGKLARALYIGEVLSFGDYQSGYYLVFPSMALFLSASILNEVTKKQQTKDSISV